MTKHTISDFSHTREVENSEFRPSSEIKDKVRCHILRSSKISWAEQTIAVSDWISGTSSAHRNMDDQISSQSPQMKCIMLPIEQLWYTTGRKEASLARARFTRRTTGIQVIKVSVVLFKKSKQDQFRKICFFLFLQRCTKM